MRGHIRMHLFHLRAFARTPYFVQLVATSTASMVLLQALAAHAYGSDGGDLIWLRAGMFGCWTTSTVASGIVGFQRFQGTLPHLMLTPHSAGSTLTPVVASASTFGLCAFPSAAGLSTLIGQPPDVESWPALIGGVAAFWLGCFAASCVIAAVFVLTPNAITYEELLVAPIVLLSGIFVLPGVVPPWLEIASFLLPMSSAARALLGSEYPPGVLLAVGVSVSIAWLIAARYAMTRALRRATVEGTLEVI